MLRLSIFVPVFFVVSLFVAPAQADLCRVYGIGLEEMGVRECVTIPKDWQQCGTIGGDDVWCSPDTGKRSGVHKHNNNTAVLVGAGVGLAVIAVAWYFFKKEPSKNNPGQVSLATF